MEDQRVFVGDLTRKEFRERIAGNVIRGAIVPTGATEQHNEHLEMINDSLHVAYVAEQAARRLHPQVVVATPVSIGVSEHWMAHKGTLTVRPEVFCEYVFDVCHSLQRGGLQHILILNGHGGNVKPLMRRLDEYRDKLKIDLRFNSYWDVYDPALARQHMELGSLPGHACEFETSSMLALDPGRVHTADIENEGAAKATRAKGEALLEPAIAGVAGVLRRMIAGEVVDLPPVTFRPQGRISMITGEPV
jgi:creatinine amidohydrolase